MGLELANSSLAMSGAGSVRIVHAASFIMKSPGRKDTV